MKNVIALLVLALVPSAAFGQTALEQLGRAAGVDVKPIVMQVKDLQSMTGRPLMIPRNPQDVLKGCSAIDAKTFRAYSLDEAAGVLNGCLDTLYSQNDPRTRRAYTVQAHKGRFGARSCPDAQAGQTASCGAIMEVEGLVITVDGRILTGDAVLMNLNFSIQQRGGKLLGFFATVDNKAAILK